jgi:hypothetical protein
MTSSTFTRRAAHVAAGLLLCAAVPSAQQFVLSSEDRARLLAVDFTALGPDGAPVTDLTPADITLRIDGRTRPVRALEYITAGDATRRVPPPFGTNVASTDSRAIVLMIEDDSLKPGGEQALKDDIRAFLAKLNPVDRVAVVTLPYGGMKSDFTSDRTRLLTALGPITGRAPQNESASDAGCRTRSTLVSLAGTLESLSNAESPVTVVLFTAGLTPPRGVESLSRQTIDGVDVMRAMGTCEVLTEHYNNVSIAAARARAQLFVIIPELNADASGRSGLEHLTGQTGAPLWNLRSGDQTALDRVVAQTAGFYLARIEPDPGESPDLVRGYSVSVNRPAVTIRHRPQMQAKRPGGPAATTTVSAPLDMMREARLFTALPLRVTATPSRNSDGSLKVVAVFDTPGSETVSSAMLGLFAADGRMVSSASLTAAELAANPIVAALTAPVGDYRLRVAAIDGQGRAGAADVDVSVALVDAGPLQLSGLLLGQSRPEGFVPRLEFSTEVSALAMLEIYGGKAGTPVGVAFEIATTENGPAMATLPGAFAPTNQPDTFVVTAAIPVGALQPGDYAIRAIVAAQGEAGGRVVKTLRKLPPQR